MTQHKSINVTKTYLPDIDKYKNYVDKIFESGWLTNHGEILQKLESALKDFLKAKNVILVANGTLALQIAYRLLDLKGEVITTPFSFVATTSSLVWEGLTPVYSDIDKNTFNIDENGIENKINSRTSAILPVHVFGNPCNTEAMNEISAKYNLPVIYDAAHTFGVNYNNLPLVNYGNISVLSFHSTKIFHTVEGGALIFNDNNLYEKAKLLTNFGISGYDKINELGINAKMNEFQAAMGMCMLDEFNDLVKKREEVYNIYLKAFENNEKIGLQKIRDNTKYNYSYFPIVFRSEEILFKTRDTLNNENIYPRRYFYPSLESLPYIQKKQKMPVSESLSRRILCLPLYNDLEVKIQNKIIDIILEITNKNT